MSKVGLTCQLYVAGGVLAAIIAAEGPAGETLVVFRPDGTTLVVLAQHSVSHTPGTWDWP